MKLLKNKTGQGIAAIMVMLPLITTSCNKLSNSYTWETTPAKKGSIINTITATGTIEADTTVLIGTQVSGVINKIYVDFNSKVKKGQLLAELDKTPLLTQVQQAQASLDDAKSEVAYQTATYERYKALLAKKLVAQADFDQVKYNYEKAKADLKTANAGFDKAQVNLSYASIYSPISGVVLNRAVDQGQTVAASFNTPNLFTIANDLSKLQVQANVDEADIGQVKTGQPVDFTVDAYPYETFKGVVRQIRLQPVVTSNVVTYTVIIDAPNPEENLMPGMTANITVIVQKLDSVLVVPGKALRFIPDAGFLADYMKNNPYGRGRNGVGSESSLNNRGQQGMMYASAYSGDGAFQDNGQQQKKPVFLWIKNDDTVHRVRVTIGASDGTNTEIKSGLKPGDEVVLSMSRSGKNRSESISDGSSESRSPFMPQRPRGRGR